MGTADKLVDLMFRWMEKRERCAEQLRELARELEVLREKCNGSQCFGNSVSVLGAVSLLGASVATLCTGGLAAPFLGFLGAAYTVVGLTISGVTQLTEYLSSSERTKKAESIESESKRIAKEINDLFEQLKAECKAESVNADEDELDQLVMAKLPAAIARRNDQKWTVCDSIELSSSSGPENAPLLNQKQNAFAVGLVSVLAVFAFKASGKKARLLVAEAGKQLIKKMSTTGLKIALKVGDTALKGVDTAHKVGRTALKVGRTALKGGGLVAVGVVGLAFALHEAIDSWKEMIKNNHVTEASQSLRDTADSLDEISRTLMNQFEDIKQRMAQRQREYEEMLEEEELEEEKKETPFVRAALLNVHSMTYKALKILDLIRKDHLQVFFSTETWLKSETAGKVLKEASPEGFSFFFHVSELRGFRGVAIQFSPVLHAIQIQFKNNMKSFEYVATVLKHTKWKEPVLSINLYRPPNKTLETIHKFVKEFQELLNEVYIKNILVTGDFNIWVDVKTKTYVKVFDCFLLSNGFVRHPNKPTFNRSIHILDLVLTKNVEVSDVKVRNNKISDHKTVQFNWRPYTVSRHFVL